MHPCEWCGSTLLVALGTLGTRLHYRCRLCGMTDSCDAPESDYDPAEYTYDSVFACAVYRCSETAMSGSAYCRDHKAEERRHWTEEY